ncbi:hypothetical protein [Acidianus sp. RZ1]|uniref:hypothetical protein n=1 Tax=Acidianus sp. RZ1 TaxID=1540082 RepID=UPI001492C97A|nr:hypothetical protein [Acidianus sp. RZ1]NON63450.1 hypothetical protein [Acidianus sp. RZ1]
MNKMRTRIAIVGSYTIDEIKLDDKVTESPGGSPVYSSLGVISAGGTPVVYSAKGKDFKFNVSALIEEGDIQTVEKSLRFKIEINSSGRRLILQHSIGKMTINWSKIKNNNGVIVSPVCNEVDPNGFIDVDIPIALDVQGFIRNCVEDQEISYTRLNLPRRKYTVIHSNYDEMQYGNFTVKELLNLGAQEVIISYGDKGFSLFYGDSERRYFTRQPGNVNVGNGDYLLAAYFTLRLRGYTEVEAGEEALELTENFSNFGPKLMLPPT